MSPKIRDLCRALFRTFGIERQMIDQLNGHLDVISDGRRVPGLGLCLLQEEPELRELLA
jgi:hypothetical protein